MPKSIGNVVQAVPSKKSLTIRMVDADGGLTSYNFPIGLTLSDAGINAFIDAYAAVTNASIYEAVITNNFGNGIPQRATAIDAPRVSVMDVINLAFKPTNPLNVPLTLELRAPITATLDGLFVDQTNALLQTLITSFDNATSPLGLGYTLARLGFTERTKKHGSVLAE